MQSVYSNSTSRQSIRHPEESSLEAAGTEHCFQNLVRLLTKSLELAAIDRNDALSNLFYQDKPMRSQSKHSQEQKGKQDNTEQANIENRTHNTELQPLDRRKKK